MCQWRRDLAAVAQATPIREGLEAAERVMGLEKVGPVPVLALAQGQGEAELEGVALQPFLSVAIKSNRAIQSLPCDRGSRAPRF